MPNMKPTRAAVPARTDSWHPRTIIIVAAVTVFVVVAWVPFGSTALYPLTLFTTWVHEMGHGLTALAFGGEFRSLEIHANAGGLAHAYAGHGWPDAMVAAGGVERCALCRPMAADGGEPGRGQRTGSAASGSEASVRRSRFARTRSAG